MEEKAKGEAREEVEEEKGKEIEHERPLDKMTAKELREIALEIPGVTGVHAMKKEQLLKIIKEARGIEEPKKKKEKVPKKEINVRDLKQKISRLKEEKESARSSRDKKRVEVLRRRINRLKKQSRKAAHA